MATDQLMEIWMRTRRRWTPEQKAKILAECDQPGMSLSSVARAYAIAPRLLFQWKQAAADSDSTCMVPASRLREAETRIDRLEKLLEAKLSEDAGNSRRKSELSQLSATGRVRAEGRIITLLCRCPANRAKLLAYIGFEVMPHELDEVLQSMVERRLIERIDASPRGNAWMYKLAVGMRVSG